MKTKTSSFPIILSLVCIALMPKAQAVVPPPDGNYPNGNTAEGQNALFSLTTGQYNAAIGFFSLEGNKTGSFNTAVGAGSLFANLGDQNTATGAAALLSNTTGSLNTANGEAALFFNTTGTGNTAVGSSALLHNTIASNNTAVGSNALGNTADADNNTAVGFNALQDNTNGAANTAMGTGALLRTTGNNNTALGAAAGTLLVTGNNNIYVGNLGAATEDNTVRIGNPEVHTATFIAGINGADEGSPTAVFINTTTGQLGTTPPSSSKRFKTAIKPMDDSSEAILALKPVTFQYKSDATGREQFGLIAEEVAKVNPALVLMDKEGKPYTVRYDAVNAMLLNEFLKARRQLDAQQKQIAELTAVVQKVSEQIEASNPPHQLVENHQ